MARILLPIVLTLIPMALLTVLVWAVAVDRSLDLPQFGRGYVPVSYTHLTLPTKA